MESTAERDLLDLKQAALDASARRDAAFFRSYLADDARAVTPHGVATRDDVVQAAERGGFQSVAIDDTEVSVLDDNAGIVTYRATFADPDGGTHDVFVTTIYRRDAGTWKGVLYQQTPLPG